MNFTRRFTATLVNTAMKLEIPFMSISMGILKNGAISILINMGILKSDAISILISIL